MLWASRASPAATGASRRWNPGEVAEIAARSTYGQSEAKRRMAGFVEHEVIGGGPPRQGAAAINTPMTSARPRPGPRSSTGPGPRRSGVVGLKEGVVKCVVRSRRLVDPGAHRHARSRVGQSPFRRSAAQGRESPGGALLRRHPGAVHPPGQAHDREIVPIGVVPQVEDLGETGAGEVVLVPGPGEIGLEIRGRQFRRPASSTPLPPMRRDRVKGALSAANW